MNTHPSNPRPNTPPQPSRPSNPPSTPRPVRFTPNQSFAAGYHDVHVETPATSPGSVKLRGRDVTVHCGVLRMITDTGHELRWVQSGEDTADMNAGHLIHAYGWSIR